MAVRVLVVDDSVFFRNRIKQILTHHPDIEVVDTAKNGTEAVAKVKQLHPDVVTMDVEMPEMDGITALKQIMAECPCQVVMLSSLTRRSAAVTLEALALGAADYMEKDARQWLAGSGGDDVEKELAAKILALGGRKPRPGLNSRSEAVAQPASALRSPVSAAARPKPAASATDTAGGRSGRSDVKVRIPDCGIVTIGSSTGGPAALQFILTQIPADFPVPILITQHMPKAFTSVFAKRLDDLCAVRVKEAENGDKLFAGHVYLAPGGQQMILDPSNSGKLIIRESDERMTYKPSVDLTFASVAKGYGRRAVALVLTGMGADGCDGARLLKKAGATVWAQDKDSCTIFGMPKAVIEAELADAVLNLENIRQLFKHWGH
ncbi:protein-glutamate methylesterase/protein-glutamine glutaminase [Amphritea pacifica]|uniref:Protein-glutamate methylesterase/protein-glutamine glutaminase n=1 Tax=Amphritea pacifica TaxID=2811233 RepID=A0ABS2W563_9GAMM|nr:chemotaxis response regulator protein-glutamate methylesterase [Amphritea pacifica]MBN0986844.1 chemotaxis response regulator protein-glutamate methylesterase [Amphritea pacifica]MBN1005285.1 chemotaxis response regulator protein-glutamate methylesterase [Amphritea pacifica]